MQAAAAGFAVDRGGAERGRAAGAGAHPDPGRGGRPAALPVVDEADFVVDEAAAAKSLGPAGRDVVAAAITALEDLPEWTTPAIETALSAALIDGLGLKPRDAYTPIRVAVTGRTVSPPLFESLELLGARRALKRLRGVSS